MIFGAYSIYGTIRHCWAYNMGALFKSIIIGNFKSIRPIRQHAIMALHNSKIEAYSPNTVVTLIEQLHSTDCIATCYN